ncbi:DNA-directed RNA polymerase subunit beta [Ureibacillus thermosphaericus]|uniref:DNA-directed RNA polymerase subunit beta n=1 Tax=Ureibacillus thermosphaericus TaxID=51173 RepID=UPI000BBCDA25|nr:DNA-directed RNA polymerase subunit beta [Ureibacillus thermosphaericus]
MANEMKSGSTLSNQDIPQKRAKRQDRNEKHPKFKIYRTRLIPIWLRIVIVLVLLLLASVFGLMIGFGVIGDGNPLDALKWETYQHILDIINGIE